MCTERRRRVHWRTSTGSGLCNNCMPRLAQLSFSKVSIMQYARKMFDKGHLIKATFEASTKILNFTHFFHMYLKSILVHCKWTDWTWGGCSKTCDGIQNGTRTISQAAKNGGNNCTGPSANTRSCSWIGCPGG